VVLIGAWMLTAMSLFVGLTPPQAVTAVSLVFEDHLALPWC
jgi:hypothetical protein